MVESIKEKTNEWIEREEQNEKVEIILCAKTKEMLWGSGRKPSLRYKNIIKKLGKLKCFSFLKKINR